MDVFDKASEVELRDRRLALLQRKPTLPYINQCHNCEETVPETAHFCDADCRDDYERRERAKK